MLQLMYWSGHGTKIHSLSQEVLSPEPLASMYRCMSTNSMTLEGVRIEIPFQVVRKASHQWRSVKKSACRLTWWCSWVTKLAEVIILQRKGQLVGSTLHVKERDLMRERRSFCL